MAANVVRFKSGPSFSRQEKLRARTLYLVKGWTPSEIAEELGKEPRQISNLVNHQGWAKARREAEEKAAAKAENAAISNAQAFVESVAIRSEEMADRGFDLAEKAAAGEDFKGFAMAASGTKTFVGLTRQALGMDSQSAGGISITVNAIHGEPIEVQAKPVEETAQKALESADAETDLDFA